MTECKRDPIRKYPQKPRTKDALPSIPIENIPQTKLIPLTRIIHDYDRINADASYQFSQLISALQTLGKSISAVLRKSGISQCHILGADIYQKSASELTSLLVDLAIKLIETSNSTCLILTKNVKDVIKVPKEHSGRYIVAISVLDKKITPHATTCAGTLFCIFKRADEIIDVIPDEVLQPGKNAIAAGYIIYGNMTLLVLALKKKVKTFTLDPVLGEFILRNDEWRIPEYGYFYSVNHGTSETWDAKLEPYFNELLNSKGYEKWESRYTGSPAIDCHYALQMGGIYLHPANKKYPTGRVYYMKQYLWLL
ncbi:fructose-1,6-bisphosphatase 1-like isoform X2 [Rhodnius prolixus]|uniref:fructose-1,6-bisphosphatase 1-like isoform X2 n=1 Tax=Rhodnius prolixus TaxID=13249 RepID=UPI003D18F6CC